MRKWLLLVLLLLCPLFQSVDAFWLVSYQTGERYQYAGGGMFFDEMGEAIYGYKSASRHRERSYADCLWR